MRTTLKVYKGKRNRRKIPVLTVKEVEANQWKDFGGAPIDSRHLLLSMLLPSAIESFMSDLKKEVQAMCGARYAHDGSENQRWGSQPGSIILGRQHVRIAKPRVRNKEGKEVPIGTYEKFQDPSVFEQSVFDEGIKKVSQRDYARGLPKIHASFGFSKSSISRRWIKVTEKELKLMNERDLKELKIIAVFIDGKRFRKKGVVVAVGVSESGKKYILGIYECNSENSAACKNLLDNLEGRGLPASELLFVVDGGSGLNKALEEKYDVHDPTKRRAVRIRCFKHKWNNISENLSDEAKDKAAKLFWAIRDARDLETAEKCSEALEDILKEENISAHASYLEAKEDLLNIHRLGLSFSLRIVFSTTNPIESLNSLSEDDLHRVKCWENSAQFQRWLAGVVP